MRHRKSGRKLNKKPAHRKAMFANMATSLFEHERIQTTTPKAKELRSVAEKLITLAKRGDLHARRQAARIVKDPVMLTKLFSDLATRFEERPGGYTRVLHIGKRRGDNAPMSIIELVGAPEASVEEYVEDDVAADDVGEDAEE
ncbi:MAG: large subunit ribosomal protein L17 [Bradymonadia bacterium]|jgi:large subunit ribosomal protein L17